MKILVTGGTGVIGAGVIPELLARGHQVRLLSRHAHQDAAQWEGVEPFRGDVSDPSTLGGAANDCDAVIHIAGIVAENPPKVTFQRVNVDGTKNLAAEAKRAGAKRFLFVSSLGADRGQSDYHQSKLAAERIVEQSGLEYTIVRPGNVYGPGDEVISLILKMIRALPVVPVIDLGDQQFQPIWFEDLGKAIAALAERSDVAGRSVEVSGAVVTTMNDVIGRLSKITDRNPLSLPVPMKVAEWAAKIASMGTLELPIDENKLTMLREKNVLEGENALTGLLQMQPTPLDEGLRKLADAMPELLPEDGVGALQHKKFWGDIKTRSSAVAVMTLFRDRVNDAMPIEFAAEPGAPERVEPGATMTAHIPMRGNIQIRVEVVEPTRCVFATLEGHPLAGIVQFTTKDLGTGDVRFQVDVYARASNFFDWFGMKTIGRPAQSANWRGVVQRMIDLSGGTSEGVHSEVKTLDEDEAARVEKSVRSIVQGRQRAESAELR
ncbi:MAG TPA: DUF1990 family protein [Thermoanaerobaculia bacterium]|jgi:NADH dehydrogenase